MTSWNYKIIFSLLLSLPLLAVASPDLRDLRPLAFPVEKNNVQVLPQRFEYALLENGQIQLGNILIDQSQLNFQISETSAQKYQLTFHWPARLLREGRLIVKNSIGKAVVSQKIAVNDSGTDIAEANVVATPEQIEAFKSTPILSFCVFSEEVDTRIYLCSAELFLSHQNTPYSIRSRGENNRTAQVEINGQNVGLQGYIFLNSAREKIHLKMFAPNGASLEVETSRKDFDLKDIVLSTDRKKLLITATGAEPMDEKQVQKINEEDWQASLDVQRPSIYVKGDGGIPMRQELLVKGEIPTTADRTYTDRSPDLVRTYSSTASLNIYSPTNTTPQPLDKNAQVETASLEHMRWNLENIPQGKKTRRYLAIKGEKQSYIVSQDFFRGYAYELGASLQYATPSGLGYGQLFLNAWLSPGDLHWGLHLEHQAHLTTKTTEPKLDQTSVDVLYRFQSGFYLEDETWGASVSYQTLRAQDVSLGLPRIGLFTHQKVSSHWQNWLSWYQLHLQYSLGGSTSQLKLKQAYQLSAQAYKTWTPQVSWLYGFDIFQYKFDPAAAKEDLQLALNLGISYRF